jgi:diguanylate cyclase (GGDEF)-like protein/PAS domain S-box-containing protein
MSQLTRCVAMYVGFPVVYALSTVAGRATRLAGGEVALVWPAAAVAVIWLIAARPGSRRERAIHVSMLAVLTFAMNLLTGAAPLLGAWFVLVNVTLAVVAVEILTYRRDDVVLRDPADLARLVAAVTGGSCCAAVLATVFMATVNGAPVWETFALFAVRNGATALLGVSVWLQFRTFTWRRPHMSALAVAEALLVGAGVIAVYVWIFWLNTGVPMAFLTLVPAMWLALRYSTTVSTVFLTLAGAWIIFATLSDRGVFIVQNIQERALLAQAMVGSLTLIVLALSLYRDSRARLIAQLETARDQADQDSELLGAVLDSIHDSVILVDPARKVVLQNARADDSGLVDQVVTASGGDDAVTAEVDSARARRRDIVVAAHDSRVVELTTAPLPRQSLFTVMAFRDVTEERENARALREARDLFAGVLEAASEQAIIGTDPAGHITVFNNGAERLLGWTREEMLGRTPMDFHYYPEVCARAEELGMVPGLEVFVRGVTPEQAQIREWIYVRRDGTHAAVSLAVSQMTDEDGGCVGYIGVATDITERKAAESALAESEERFRLAFDTAPMGMFMFEVMQQQRGGCITRCNQAMGDLLGREPADVLGMTVTGLGSDESASGPTGLRRLLTLRIGQLFEAEMAFRRVDGHTVWGAVAASIVAPQGSNPYGICLVEDITTRRRVEAELQHLALHDPLTGLANRALLTDRIDHALARAERGESGRIGLIFLDLDGFKAVNDTWGHAQGDEVLEIVARRIQTSIRPGDTAARLGGDEFAVLCPGTCDVDQLKSVADRIRRELRRPVMLADGGTYDQLSVSAGVVVSHSGCTAETLLQRADKLMYQAKRSGKDCVTGGSPAEEAAVMRAVQLISEIDRALECDEFVVHVQPIVDLRTGGWVAAEALLRWQHPERGMLTPDQFLDVAEATRYMPAIGRHVLVEACRQACQWTGAMATASVHVNVSGRQLEVGDFYADVHDALDRTGLRPDRLVLEMTETYAGLVANSTKADLNRLRRKGVRIAIDDVGTGFSGLAKIVDLPIDILKIDKQFIAGLPQDARCAAITKAILSLGSSLVLTVIAEGIERSDQHELLVSWGCEFGQGFLYGRPVSETQMSAAGTPTEPDGLAGHAVASP